MITLLVVLYLLSALGLLFDWISTNEGLGKGKHEQTGLYYRLASWLNVNVKTALSLFSIGLLAVLSILLALATHASPIYQWIACFVYLIGAVMRWRVAWRNWRLIHELDK